MSATDPSRVPFRLFAAVAAAGLVIDQLTKTAAVRAVTWSEITVGPGRLHVFYNTGASFSLGQGQGKWFTLVAVVSCAVMARWAWNTKSSLTAAALGLLAAGAAGNAADRITRGDSGVLSGAVVDFIYVGAGPVFNFADVLLTAGAAVWLVVTIRSIVSKE